MWKSNDNLMYSNLIYMLTAYAFPIWISEIRSQQGIKKENERTRADSKQPMYAFSSVQFSSLQSLSRVQLFVTPWITARQASLSITNSLSSPKLVCIESVMPSSHLILCHPLLLLPPIPPSIRVFSNESTLRMRWPTYWSFSLSINPSNEHPGLVSFRMDHLLICNHETIWFLPFPTLWELHFISSYSIVYIRNFDRFLLLFCFSSLKLILLDYSCYAMLFFYCTAKWISYMYTHVPSFMDFVSI